MPVPTLFGAAGGTLAQTTWNPSDKNAGIALSSVNRLATRSVNTPANGEAVRATNGKSSGKWYWACVPTGVTGFGNISIGMATLAASLSDDIGNNAGSVGYFDGGNVRLNGGSLGTPGAYSNSDEIDIAVDIGGQLIWVRGAGGSTLWNNSAPANPTTGVGGFSFAGISAGALYPAASFGTSVPGTGLLRVITSEFARAAPSGFTAWG